MTPENHGFTLSTESTKLPKQSHDNALKCLQNAFRFNRLWFRQTLDGLEIIGLEAELAPNDRESIRSLFRCDSDLNMFPQPSVGGVNIGGRAYLLISLR